MELPLRLLIGSLPFLLIGLFLRKGREIAFFHAGLWVFFAFDLFALRYYVTHVEPERLVVRKIRIATPKLTESIRIVHLSDIQAGEIGKYQREIFRKIQELEPDLVLNTGDYLQVVPPATFDGELAKLIDLKARLRAKFGVYGVFGDTEMEMYRIPMEKLAPLVLLSSNSLRIDTGAGVISLHGLSLYESDKPEWALRSIESWLEGSDSRDFRILMGHSPNYALGVADYPIDLCLAGHTHGGQVRLPFYGALTTYSDVPKEWSRGFRSVGIPFLNVSAGAGSNRRHGLPPMRFNCPTEMTLIELVPLDSSLKK